MKAFYLTAAGISLAVISESALSENDLFSFDKNVKVLTPTKLLQSLHDTPASVTIISKSDIKRLGIKDIPEVMRLVPGMSVGMTRGNDYQLAYLNPSVRATRRLQVLIDGMSVYRLGFSNVYWLTLPVNIQDIERIEVTRSPSSTTYGVNSFEAVINIITKHPADNQGSYVEIYSGAIETNYAYASYGDKINNTSYRIALSHRKNTGYDETENFGEDRRDDTDVSTVFLHGVTELDNNSLEYQFSYVDGTLSHNNSDEGRITPSDGQEKEIFTNLNYFMDISNNHKLKIHYDLTINDHIEEWKTCYPGILFTENLRSLYLQNPDYANTIIGGNTPSGGSASDDALATAVFNDINNLGAAAFDDVCGIVNENIKETRSNLAIEDTFVFSNTLRTVSGLGIYYNAIDSETYLDGNGKYDDITSYLFSNWEYRFSNFVLNSGIMIENEEERNNETLVSPRIALNYNITNTDTIRFIVSKSKRSPDIFETTGSWNYYMRNITPTIQGNSEAFFVFHAGAENTLVPEEIISKEISYYGVFPSINTKFDIKFFKLEMDKLMSQKISFFDFNPDNNNEGTRKGAELELHILASNSIQFSLGFSRLLCDGTHVFEDATLCARNSGFSNLTYKFNNNLYTTLAYYASSNISGFPYHRTDFIINKGFNTKNYDINLSLIARYYAEDNGFTVNEDLDTIENKFYDKTHVFGSISISF